MVELYLIIRTAVVVVALAVVAVYELWQWLH